MRIDKVSKDTRTTKANPAFVAYVTLHVANDMRNDGLWMLADILEKAGAKMAMEYGRMPEDIAVPEADWDAVYADVVATLKEQAAAYMMDRTASGLKN